jgi:hypothetical protein
LGLSILIETAAKKVHQNSFDKLAGRMESAALCGNLVFFNPATNLMAKIGRTREKEKPLL